MANSDSVAGVAKKSVGYHLIASDASDVETGGYDRQQISVVMYQVCRLSKCPNDSSTNPKCIA